MSEYSRTLFFFSSSLPLVGFLVAPFIFSILCLHDFLIWSLFYGWSRPYSASQPRVSMCVYYISSVLSAPYLILSVCP